MRPRFLSTALLAVLLGCALSTQAADRKAKGSADTLSRTDRQFIDKAVRENQAEIALAKIAQEKASSDQVKQYAQRLFNDHSKAGSELEGIVSKLGYRPSGKADKAHKGLRKFEKMSGEKFDREFVKHMVDDHERSVKLFKNEAQDGQAQEVWQFAQKTLPTLEEHLRIARELSGDKGGRRDRAERRKGKES